jgi:indole-3-glycerol phosphate synthase
MTILEKIIENKQKEVRLSAELTHVKELEKSRFFTREIISLSESLSDKNRTGIIAEFKRKSPSKGILNSVSSVAEVASGYFREGASGISILTDVQFFGGSNSDLSHAREKGIFPILRKDFIIDEYQVIESKSIGADAILLIGAVLGKKRVLSLSELARSIGLEVLLEIHGHDEIDMINEYVNIVGVNNRDLRTFSVNTRISEKMAHQIPPGILKISESGISSPVEIKKLRVSGYDGFLMGERFMSTPDPVKSFSEFIKDIE